MEKLTCGTRILLASEGEKQLRYFGLHENNFLFLRIRLHENTCLQSSTCRPKAAKYGENGTIQAKKVKAAKYGENDTIQAKIIIMTIFETDKKYLYV